VSVLIAILALVLVGLVLLLVGAPLRAARRAGSGATQAGISPQSGGDPQPVEHADLDAEREAKYREIRDAELDYRTGKLSSEDYEAIDAQLRAEALEILDRVQAAEGESSGDEAAASPSDPPA
jgi:hypothetical protein